MSILQIRLKNCLQTILDLQPSMRKFYHVSFADDFSQLKSYLMRIDNMELAEEDVARLENMTSEFLREVGISGYQSTIPQGRLQ